MAFETNLKCLFSECYDPMLNGEESVFSPKGGSMDSPDPEGFSRIRIPNDGTVVFRGTRPAEITKFTLKVNEICSKDGTLLVKVVYFGDAGRYSTVSVLTTTIGAWKHYSHSELTHTLYNYHCRVKCSSTNLKCETLQYQ